MRATSGPPAADATSDRYRRSPTDWGRVGVSEPRIHAEVPGRNCCPTPCDRKRQCVCQHTDRIALPPCPGKSTATNQGSLREWADSSTPRPGPKEGFSKLASPVERRAAWCLVSWHLLFRWDDAI